MAERKESKTRSVAVSASMLISSPKGATGGRFRTPPELCDGFEVVSLVFFSFVCWFRISVYSLVVFLSVYLSIAGVFGSGIGFKG